MADSNDRTEQAAQANPEGVGSGSAAEDSRKPYEAPRIVKKRSVARATLVTAMGPTATSLAMVG